MTIPHGHDPVMLQEVLGFLRPKPGGTYVDLTAGMGGHSAAILEAAAPNGRLIAIDRDRTAIATASQRLAEFGSRVSLHHARFSELSAILDSQGISHVDGLLADLGVSSPQLDVAERGFSFSHAGPIDMRMDTSRGRPASELLRVLREEELADVIYRFGEERRSRGIARAIKAAVERDELRTTVDLARIVERAYGGRGRMRIHPATRTFQALRMVVNEELDELRAAIDQFPRVLNDGAVAVIITFHSLEDRLVKHAFRDNTALVPLTKRPVTASPDEVERNRRARSAKLRAAERLPRNVAARGVTP